MPRRQMVEFAMKFALAFIGIFVFLSLTSCAVSLYSNFKCKGECEVTFDRDSVQMKIPGEDGNKE